MSTNFPIPSILQPEQMKQLNNLVFESTGCFLFLTTPKDSYFHMPYPNDYKDCYVYDVLNLYKVYYDFSGKILLWICLQDKQLPSSPDADSPADIHNRLSSLRYNRSDILAHYKLINESARHIIAHGIFYDKEATDYVDPKIETFTNWSKKIIGKEYPATNNDWHLLSDEITQKSNSLVLWIKEWAELWKYCTKTKEAMKKRFYNGKWSKANGHCTLQPDRRIRDLDSSSTYIYFPCGRLKENEEGTPYFISSFENAFSEQLVRNLCHKIAVVTGKNVEVAPKNAKVSWSSNIPDNNWELLCNVINFYGIDRVKEEIIDKSPDECPDIYQIYLNGLINAATRIPKAGTQRKSSSNYFKRTRIRSR